jgi:hypothetical protein
LAKAVPKQRDQGLRACIDSQPLASKSERGAVMKKIAWRHFTKHRFANDQGQTGVAATHGVTYAVFLRGVKEQYLVRFSNGLVVPEVSHVDTAVWKDQLSSGDRLYSALLAMTAATANIPELNC